MKIARVLKSSILSTIQDCGRKGLYSIGIPNGGAFDIVSFKFANALIANDLNDAGIEVLWGGFKILFLESTEIAVTGADLNPTIDNKSIPMWRRISVEKGQILNLDGPPKSGVHAYIGLQGGIDVPEFYGSKSTYLIMNQGGYKGRKLKKDDILTANITQNKRTYKEIDDNLIPSFKNPTNIRIVIGLQKDLFDKEDLTLFNDKRWTLTNKTNRVGLRLKGQTIRFKKGKNLNANTIGGKNPSNIPTEGNPLGTIEVPSESELIIIGPDGPCEGGYAKIGTIISADLHLLGQLKPGDQVTFTPVSLEEAYKALYEQHEMIRMITASGGRL